MDLERLQELYAAVLEQAPEAREAFLSGACDDERLRRRVKRMTADAIDAEAFLETPLSVERSTRALDEATARHHDPLIGAHVGRYEVLRVIGVGGMGVVYEAKQDSPSRRVALKLLRPGWASRSVMRRFEQEAEVLGRLRHPGIAQVFESGVIDVAGEHRPFFAMELVEGRPITRDAEARGLTVAERLELMARVCDAVEHAHRKGVIHRDLKPGNILVDDGGHPKVLDFGVARATNLETTMHTEAGQIVGTVAYMSPEQAQGRSTDLDARSDVYSLGVVLFQLLCDRFPHDVSTMPLPEAVRTVAQDEPSHLSTIDPTLRGDVDTIVARALERDPSRRYQTAADIRRYLRDEPIVARRASAIYRARKFVRRHQGLVGGVTSALAVLVVALILVSVNMVLAARGWTRAEAINQFVESVLSALDPYQIPRGGKLPESFGANVLLVDVLDEVVRRFDTQPLPDPVAEAMVRSWAARSYFGAGRYDDGVRNGAWALTVLRDHLGEDDRRTLDCKLALSHNLTFSFDSYRAQRLAEEAVDGCVRVYGECHEQTLRALHCLWLAHLYLGSGSGCAAVNERMARIVRESARPLDYAVFSIKVERALWLIGEGRIDAAEALLHEAIAEGEADGAAGTRSPFMAFAHMQLARIAAARGDHVKAEACQRTGVQIWRAVAGEAAILEFECVLDEYVSHQPGRLDEGLAMMTATVGRAADRMGRDHPMVAHLRLRLADRLARAERLDLAESCCRDYLASVERGGHPRLPRHALARRLLAMVLLRRGSVARAAGHAEEAVASAAEAELELRRAMEIAAELTLDQWLQSGMDDRWLLVTLARALREQGRLADAEGVYSRLAARADEPFEAWSTHGIALNLCRSGRHAEAEPYARRAVEEMRRRGGDAMAGYESPYCERLDTWARALEGLARPVEAEAAWREAAGIWSASPEKVRGAARFAVRFGRCLGANGRFDEAEAVLQRVLIDLEAQPDARPALVRQTRSALAEMYLACGRPDAAAAYSDGETGAPRGEP